MEAKKRGGPGRGQGRKTLAKSGEVMKPHAVRMTDAEWEKFLNLGGSEWLRDKIRRSKLPET